MQIQYASAGSGNNPKSPPPSSQLLREYMMYALEVQDLAKKIYTEPVMYELMRVHAVLDHMSDLYADMNDVEQEIVDASHLPIQLVKELQRLGHSMLHVSANIAALMAKRFHNTLYSYQEKDLVPCSFH